MYDMPETGKQLKMTRKIKTLIILLTLCQVAFSQDITKCEKIVELTIQAINKKSSSELENHLSEDFTMAGQKGSIAKLVLQQLLAQLGEKVNNYEKLDETTENEELELVYAIEYEKMGKKNATFIFSSDNQLKELNLFKMEVKTMDSETKIKKSEKNFIKVPFRMAGKLIAVDVMLNGFTKTFILDSGSPKVILNSKYLEKSDSTKKTISSSKGVSGSISGMDIQEVEHLDWQGIELINQKLITLDLSHLEAELETEIYGLIGFELIKDYDLLFDYDNKELILINPDYFSQFKANNLTNNKLTRISMVLNSHIPIIQANVGNKTLSLGIDCGAESNLIDDDLFDDLRKQLKKITEDELIGADNNPKKVKTAKIKSILIGGKMFKMLNTTFSDISHLNEGYKIQIDGLIGYEVLSKQKTILSYKRKELIFVD